MPWWKGQVQSLLAPEVLEPLTLGALWRLAEGLRFVRANVERSLLSEDFERDPSCRLQWDRFVEREAQVERSLEASGAREALRIQRGELGPAAFRATWEGLGFATNARDAGTPADDYLDGLFHLPELEADPGNSEGSPNMASRAERTADFLATTHPTCEDVVMDLGSGQGKLALTVSASTFTQVVGVEYGQRCVDSAGAAAHALSLQNLRFIHADVRDVDLSLGNIFYLYYPFRGEVARTVAERLGALARQRDITVYASGPSGSYGEYFTREVEKGALELRERRGPFSEVLVLRSAKSP